MTPATNPLIACLLSGKTQQLSGNAPVRLHPMPSQVDVYGNIVLDWHRQERVAQCYPAPRGITLRLSSLWAIKEVDVYPMTNRRVSRCAPNSALPGC